jgi:hypothetical protein
MSIPSSELRWSGATPGQLAFMRRVYDAHVARAAAARTFIDDLPAGALADVEHGKRMRTAAAADCRAMLAAARADLASDGGHDVRWIGIASGYRSAREQFAIWQKNFPRYYADTETERGQSDGGSHGDDAVTLLARYAGQRVAAPGYSLHNDGRAADLKTSERDLTLGADTSQRTPWRQTWLWSWLTGNAARFHFFQNTHIDEPWHWEHRPASAEEDAEDSTTIAGGELALSSVPLLAQHAGAPPALFLRWNDMTLDGEIDVVVHLHGNSRRGKAMDLLKEKVPVSGLDPQRRQRPTLCVLPHGHFDGTSYEFPALITPDGLGNLILFAIEQFAVTNNLTVQPVRKRLILTAHSHGGRALEQILKNSSIDPDEIHVFDATYDFKGLGINPLRNWADRHITQDKISAAGTELGALRVIFFPNTGTQAKALELQQFLNFAIPWGSVLDRRYRVEKTTEPHPTIPKRFGGFLLADTAADLK